MTDAGEAIRVTFEGGSRGMPASRRSIACSSRSAGARTGTMPGLERTRVAGGRRAGSSSSTSSGGPPSRRSSRSATSSASRCSRTRRRTRGASPSKRSPATERRVRARGDSGGRVHRSGDRVGRADRDAGAEAGANGRGRASFPWGASGRAITLDRTDGVTKLVHRPGAPSASWASASCGPGAGELIAEGVLAIEMGATATRRGARDSPAPDAHRDDDGVRRGVLRHGHARLPAQEEIVDCRLLNAE